MKSSGVNCIALSEKAETSINDYESDGPFCLVMGDEGSGVSHEVMSLGDTDLRIPMMGNSSSLNVSVSAGIAIYKLNS